MTPPNSQSAASGQSSAPGRPGQQGPVSRDQALELMRHHIRAHAPQAERVPLEAALGRVCSDDQFAARSVPGVPRSSMDGYAVRAAETTGASLKSPAELKLAGEIRPSTCDPGPLAPGCACVILTGGPLPPGADAVIAAEDVEAVDVAGQGVLRVFGEIQAETHVREVGSDIRAGTRVVRRGEEYTPPILAALALSGVMQVPVYANPDVQVLAVGNELTPLDAAPVPGLTSADNLLLAAGLLRQRGLVGITAEVCPNGAEAVAGRLKAAGEPACIVTTGGTGPGQRDFLLQAAKQAGFEILFHGLKMHPGKSVFAAVKGRTILFALPGTPWAVFALMHALVLPAACWLRGRALPVPIPVLARLDQTPPEAPPGWEKLVACTITGVRAELHAHPLMDRTREARLDMIEAQGLLLVPAHVSEGDLLPMIPIWEHKRGHRP